MFFQGGGWGGHIPPLDLRMRMIDPLTINKFSNPGEQVFSCNGYFSKSVSDTSKDDEVHDSAIFYLVQGFQME